MFYLYQYSQTREIFLGEELAWTTQAEKADVDLAVSAAERAYKSWSKTSPHVRARHLYRSDTGLYILTTLLGLAMIFIDTFLGITIFTSHEFFTISLLDKNPLTYCANQELYLCKSHDTSILYC